MTSLWQSSAANVLARSSPSRMALGTVQVGMRYGVANAVGRVSLKEATKILSVARNHGIDLLDTAISYGESEETLGDAGVGEWKVVTKLPALPDNCTDVGGWVQIQIVGSLERLHLNKLYAVLLHHPKQLFESNGRNLFKALCMLKEGGYATKIGVSIYSPEELEMLFRDMHFDVVQAPLNVLDRRLVESGWARRLKRLRVELHTRSAFLQGLLLMPSVTRPRKFKRWDSIWSTWECWLHQYKLTPLEACLRYALSVAEVDRVVLGVDSVAQMLEMLAVPSAKLPELPKYELEVDEVLINPSLWGAL